MCYLAKYQGYLEAYIRDNRLIRTDDLGLCSPGPASRTRCPSPRDVRSPLRSPENAANGIQEGESTLEARKFGRGTAVGGSVPV